MTKLYALMANANGGNLCEECGYSRDACGVGCPNFYINNPKLKPKTKWERMSGKNAPNWKIKPGKSAVHVWLNVNYGKPKKCEHCGTNATNKIYEWASKDHKYNRVREDFKRLCRSCHRIYDGIVPPSRKGKKLSTKTIEKMRAFSYIRPRNKAGKFLKSQLCYRWLKETK